MAVSAVSLMLLFLVFAISDVEFANSVFSAARHWIERRLDWYYLAFGSFILFFSIWLMFSRFGKIKLGEDTDEPEFSNFAWVSMLLSAGVGIGILFWSIAEPIFHFQSNPIIDMAGIEPKTLGAAQVATRLAWFHWGVHGWAFPAIVGLSLAYYAYRHKLPLSIRSALYPLLGERIYGSAGHTVDLLAIFCTLFGIATTLGLAATQLNSGLNILVGLENNIVNQVILISLFSIIATISTVSGVERGMRMLSVLNVRLSIVLVMAFVIIGPTVFLLGFFVSSLGDYAANFISLGFWTDTDETRNWQGSWTIFYWAWWLSWTPFVGLFMARVSRGRTIREFILGACLAPSLACFIWISVFGGTALHMELFGDGGVIEVVNRDLTYALFRTIELLNVADLTFYISALVIVLIVTWFVTSADSGTHVICTLLSIGNEHPPRKHRIIWGLGEGVIASILLIAGGIAALQAVTITAALPFSVVMIFMCYGLIKALNREFPS